MVPKNNKNKNKPEQIYKYIGLKTIKWFRKIIIITITTNRFESI